MTPTPRDLETASRLEAMGVIIRSPELVEYANETRAWVERGGSRKLRRAKNTEPADGAVSGSVKRRRRAGKRAKASRRRSR